MKSHPNRASYPQLVFGDVDGIAIHMKYEDADDLRSILKELKDFVPETNIPITRSYIARLTTQNRENLINSIKFAIFTYIITFSAALGISYKYPLTPNPEEIGFLSVAFNAGLTSVPPTIVAFFSKKVESLGELIRRE